MAFFDFLRRAAPEPGQHRGYYALYDGVGTGPEDDDAWDERIGAVDRAVEVERRSRLRWWQPAYWQGRRKLWWAGRIALASLALFLVLVAWLAITAPLNKSLQPIAAPQVTLLAADGTPIARNGAVTDEPVEIDKLPPHVVHAFLAIEDRRFYSHWGLDPRGLARAAITGVGGGSTITQQLAKFTFLTPEQTLTRKAREALIAFWLEAWLTKDEILARYLSNAYFGDNVYGLRAASLHYFYRQPEKLKPEQAMMLAGLVQAPSRFAPTKHYDRAKKRMDMVVRAMVAAGYLTEAEAARVRPPRLDVRPTPDLPTGTYFADWALPEAREQTQAGYARLTLTTTLDSRLQAIARQVTSYAPLVTAQVALVAMRPNGEVVAMIGGKDYARSPFNRATQARRQPGSTFKLFVYLAALQDGWEPENRISNRMITDGSYRPKNARGTYSDTMSLEEAFAQSSNVAAVRLFGAVGSAKVIGTARELGITAPLAKNDPSLALGTSSITLLELTSAYAAIAANAYPVRARAFPAQELPWYRRWLDGPSSFSSSTHEEMEQLLRTAINKGTGRAAMLSGPNYGKTGTTQDHRDALFVGYAGDLVVGVWIGNDDNTPLAGNITGGGLPARIWRDFMTRALGGQGAPTPTDRPDPSGPVEPLDIPDIGELPLPGGGRLIVRDGETIFQTEIEGQPVEISVGDAGIGVDADQIAEMRRRAAEQVRRAEEARRRAEDAIEAELENQSETGFEGAFPGP